MYVAIKLTDNTIRAYSTEDEATKYCKHINKNEEDRPSFDLYKLNGKRKASYIGRFRRGFGSDEFFWG